MILVDMIRIVFECVLCAGHILFADLAGGRVLLLQQNRQVSCDGLVLKLDLIRFFLCCINHQLLDLVRTLKVLGSLCLFDIVGSQLNIADERHAVFIGCHRSKGIDLLLSVGSRLIEGELRALKGIQRIAVCKLRP